MQRRTRKRLGVLFVSDDLVRVRGVLSDGDVRRTLLEDTLLLSPVEKVMNPNPVLASSIEEAEEMLGAEDLVAVPVVDREGALSALVVAQGDRFTVLRGTPAGEPDWTKLVARGDAIAVIPARGGSKRIPDKNLQRIGGETLVGLAVKAALGVDRVSAALVSTDSRDIAEAGIAAGGVAPWLRPAELARDDTPTIDVVVHAARWAVDQLDSRPSYVLLLEPTAPMRRPIHIQRAIELLDSDEAAGVGTGAGSVSGLPQNLIQSPGHFPIAHVHPNGMKRRLNQIGGMGADETGVLAKSHARTAPGDDPGHVRRGVGRRAPALIDEDHRRPVEEGFSALRGGGELGDEVAEVLGVPAGSVRHVLRPIR